MNREKLDLLTKRTRARAERESRPITWKAARAAARTWLTFDWHKTNPPPNTVHLNLRTSIRAIELDSRQDTARQRRRDDAEAIKRAADAAKVAKILQQVEES